jgi:putative ABC transport system permease protein
VLGCLVASAALVGTFSYLLLRRARLPGMQAQGMLRLAFAALQRHAALNALQTLVFALGLMLALVMVLVRGALIDDWQRELPPHRIISVNIAPCQRGAQLLGGRHHARRLYPMVPGRIVAVNGAPPRSRRAEPDREFASPSDTLPHAAGRGGERGGDASVEAGLCARGSRSATVIVQVGAGG